MVLRFSKEECRYNCIDYICYKLNRPLFPKKEVMTVNNFFDTIAFFANNGFQVEGYIDYRLLINPKLLAYKLFSNVIMGKPILNRFDSNSVILYYLSGYELYGVNEIWTHCICEFFSNTFNHVNGDEFTLDNDGSCLVFTSGREVFDSYYKELISYHKCSNYPNHEQLINMVILALVITR